MQSETNLIQRVKNSKIIKIAGSQLSLVAVLILICIVFSSMSPYFFTLTNILNLLQYSAITGVLGAGVTVAMLLGAIDLSQYAVATLSGITAALLFHNTQLPFGVIILICLLIGVVCGAINGFLIAVLKIMPMIATMGTMEIFRGIAYLLTNGKTVMVSNAAFATIGKGRFFDLVPVSIAIMAVVYCVIWFILKYTDFGRNVYAVGDNDKASFLSGINVTATKFKSLIVSAVCATVGGLIMTSQVGAAVPSSGVGSEMNIFAAVILGGISLSGGKGKITGTVLGILIMAAIQNGLTLLSVQSYYQMIISGSVLILAILFDILRSGQLKRI